MPHLSECALRGLVDTVAALAASDGPRASEGLGHLAALFGADVAGYHHLQLQERREVAVVHPVGALDAAQASPAHTRCFRERPLVAHYAATGDKQARRVSDLTTRRTFLDSPVYRDYYAPVGLDHQLGVPVARQAGELMLVTLLRRTGRQDFSDNDVLLLDVLRPQLELLHRKHPAQNTHRSAVLTWDAVSGAAAACATCGQLELPAQAGPPALEAVSSAALAPGLTLRERQVLELVEHGHTSGRIAHRLSISPRTVDKHLENAYRKLAVGSRTAALLSVQRERAALSPQARAARP